MSATLSTTTRSTGGFSQAAFDTLLASREEPDWMRESRQHAWRRFGELAMPTGREEEWMRTDIRMFKLDRFSPPVQPSQPDPSGMPPALLAHGVDLAGSCTALDGQSVAASLQSRWADQGVIYGPLCDVLAEHGDLVRPYSQRRVVAPDYDKFAALNAAFATTGTVLFVPRGITVDQPLYTLAALSDGGVDLNRTLVILEEGAEATLLAETASVSPRGGGLHCGTIELIVERGARLRYVNLQNWGDQVWHFAHQKAHVAEKANIQWTIGALGSRLAKVNQHVALTGPDAEAQVNGAMFTQGKQHLSYNTHQHHCAPYCRSDLLYKAALQDHSRTVWRGMIKVDKPAQRTDAYQRNDNLLLAPTARTDSIPGLEIEADDVRCTHGSTSGRVDDEQIFYAMTRGYTRQEAVRMIVAGFFQQIFDRISIQSVRDALAEAIGSRVQDL
jgi:Fe-S cluster assembly protein SufD